MPPPSTAIVLGRAWPDIPPSRKHEGGGEAVVWSREYELVITGAGQTGFIGITAIFNHLPPGYGASVI